LLLLISWILQMRFFPHCVSCCFSLHSICFILGFEVVLCEVVNGKGKHLIWEGVFKILHVRVHKNLLLHFTWYISGSHLKIALHWDIQLWYASWVAEETLIQILYILCGYPELLKIKCWDGALK
jgi:hypothetical protein